MVRFISEIIGCIALAAALLFGASWLYEKPQHPVDPSVPERIVLANTGSSHGVHDFDWSVAEGHTSHNFAMDSQSLWYDDSLIDYYLDDFSEDAVLVIPVSYFSLWYDEVSEDQFTAKNERYFTVLDRAHIRYRDLFDKVLHCDFPLLLLADEWEGTLLEAPATDAAASAVQANISEQDGYTREDIGRYRAAYHKKYCSMYSDEGQLLPVNEENLEALRHLLQNCIDRGITPILVTTPFMSYYSDCFDDEFYEVFYSYIDEICDTYGVEYWDYSHDERFADNSELFIDTDHLNSDGARLFTDLLFDRITEHTMSLDPRDP